MSKIKIAELFYSIQGEGRYMGVPSVFLRTFGCNFKCAGFGMPRGELSKEVESISERITEFKVYEELPLVSTGCDSYASWDPRFKDLSPMLTSDAIAERIEEILPHNKWKDEHLVITGGEPLLGWQRAYPDLLRHPKMAGLKEITFETNGTQKLTEEFKEYLVEWQMPNMDFAREVTFSVSAKLPCSGEKWEEAILPEVDVVRGVDDSVNSKKYSSSNNSPLTYVANSQVLSKLKTKTVSKPSKSQKKTNSTTKTKKRRFLH